MLDTNIGGIPDSARTGLTDEEAERRRQSGQGNEVEEHGGRSISSILRANIFTRFNAIITALAVVVLAVGDPIDAVFGLVMIINALIGIVQEIRAKRSLDAVQVLLIPSIGVRRNGELRDVAPEELVLGDVIEIEAGDQIPVDAELLVSTGLEVDESALTGESDPVPKAEADEILSGSFATSGTALACATRVGADSWAQQLTSEAKDFVLTESELRVGIDRLLWVISWMLPPLSLLLLYSQLQSNADLPDALVAAVAGVVALVPQGLVLLVSLALAIAVIRLARDKVVVQELPAVEGLARVDVLCVDKTGTLTTGELTLDLVEPVGCDPETFRNGLAALSLLDAARNATVGAIRRDLEIADPRWELTSVVPFSSVRKWSAAEFDGHGGWLLGAPEILLEGLDSTPVVRTIQSRVEELTAQSRRVLLVARAPSLAEDELPSGLEPAGLVALKEQVRPDAAETMDYFHRQNVAIRVISGDNPRTVSAVATELGIVGGSQNVDMRSIDSIEDISDDVVVFGRVRPEQKRDLVKLLQLQGHTVAMTGDGVNDIPSLKAADLGIAMDTATPATKAIAQLVLLDGRFDRLPNVVGEGRRVIANMELVSALFVTKTVYAALLVIAVGVAGVPFPFLPRHLSIIATVTIGLPAFALSFRSSDEPCRPGYLARVLHFAVPSGIFAAVSTFAAYWVVRSPIGDATLEEARTAAAITLTLSGLWILYRLVRPTDRRETLLIISLLVLFIIGLVPSPLSDFYALSLPPVRTTAVLAGVLVATIALLELVLDLLIPRFTALSGEGSK